MTKDQHNVRRRYHAGKMSGIGGITKWKGVKASG